MKSGRKKHELRLTAVVLACLGLSLLHVPSARAGEGGAVPNFELKDIEGKSFELTDHLAKGPVLIHFWATWCKPCLREMPHLDAIRKKYEGQGLTVVAISTDESRNIPKVKSYAKTHGYGFHVLLDSNQEVFRKLGGKGMPYGLLVSPDGAQRYSHTGYREGDERKLEARVAEVTAEYGKAGAREQTEAPVGETAAGNR
jgi:cytochrome c biogenesis protein CcmG, thiol:disulfide interchange protein DsbE